MGETGAGIERAEQIDTSKKSPFVNKWLEIQAVFPDFFRMKALIAERPNVVPTGIGNSASDIDPSVLSTQSEDRPPSPSDDQKETDLTRDPEKTHPLIPLNDEPISPIHESSIQPEISKASKIKDVSQAAGEGLPIEKGKELPDEKPDKVKATAKTDKKTPARPGTSKPATAPDTPTRQPTAKKSKIADQFSDLALAEETTRQKGIDAQRAKYEYRALKLKTKASLKQEKVKAAAELKKMEMQMKERETQMKHELDQQRIRLQ
ncbi:hypothetical protein K474DRAFT_1558619, partial [Panus rudis PR-1116 ss-1]